MFEIDYVAVRLLITTHYVIKMSDSAPRLPQTDPFELANLLQGPFVHVSRATPNCHL